MRAEALLLFATLLSTFVVNPLLVNSTSYQDSYSVYENGLLSTELYQKDENNSSKLTCVIDLLNSDGTSMFNVEKISEYDEKLVSFYSNYSNEKVEEYQNTKETSNIYEVTISDQAYFRILSDISHSQILR